MNFCSYRKKSVLSLSVLSVVLVVLFCGWFGCSGGSSGSIGFVSVVLVVSVIPAVSRLKFEKKRNQEYLKNKPVADYDILKRTQFFSLKFVIAIKKNNNNNSTSHFFNANNISARGYGYCINDYNKVSI